MPSRLNALRGEPLLSPPAGERSLWAEVDVPAERLMRLGIRKAESEGTWLELSAITADMKTMGLDVSDILAKHGGKLREQLAVRGGDDVMVNFVWMAANMKSLGFGVDDEAGSRKERIWDTVEKSKTLGNWDNHITLMRQMRHLGLDVDGEVRANRAAMLTQLQKEADNGWWASYSSHAAAMKSLGIVVDTEPHRAEMLKDLESKNRVLWPSYITMQARGLYELGYLTPNSAPQETRPMPELKRFRK